MSAEPPNDPELSSSTPESAPPAGSVDGAPAEDGPGEDRPAEDSGELAGLDANLVQKATRSAMWTLIGYGGQVVLRFASNMILTRLLFAEAFGLMALIQVILTALELFSDVGIGPSIIQNKRQDEDFLNTAFTIQAGRGTILWIIGCAVAWPMAEFYDEPQLVAMLPVVASMAFVAGLDSTKLFTLNRELSLGRIQILNLSAQASGLLTMIIWAIIDRSVWALVAGVVVTRVVTMVMSHTFLPGIRNKFHWDKPTVQELIRFGRWIFIGTILSFLSGQSDRLIFGKMIPLDMLGIYSIGLMIASLPGSALSHLSQNVAFPVYSRIVQEGKELKEVFAKTRYPILVLGGWAFSGLMAGGPTAMRLLYDERYHDAGWVIQAISVSSWLLLMESTNTAALFAKGRPQWATAASLAKLIAMLGLIPLGFYLGGQYSEEMAFPGAVIGYVVSEFFRYAVAAGGSAYEGLGGIGDDVKMTSLVGLFGGLGAGGAWALQQINAHIVLESAAIAVGVSLLWVPLAWPLIRKRLEARRARREGRAI